MLWPKRRTALSTFWAMDAMNPPQSTFHTSAIGGPYTARRTSGKTWAARPITPSPSCTQGSTVPVGDESLVKQPGP